MNPLGLSEEQVTQYSRLFLDAITLYVKTLKQREENKPYLRYLGRSEYSLILELWNRVKCQEGMPSGKMVRLLEMVLNEYRAHLLKVKEQPWIKEDAVQKQLAQLAEISKDGLLRGSTNSASGQQKQDN